MFGKNRISFVCIYIQKLRAEIWEVEKVLKTLIKSLENKHLDPFSQLIGRRTNFK
jgi:hypothetical protein